MIYALALLACGFIVGAIHGEAQARKWRTQLYDQRVKTSLAEARLIEYQWNQKHQIEPAYADFEMVLPEASLPFNVLLPHSINWN